MALTILQFIKTIRGTNPAMGDQSEAETVDLITEIFTQGNCGNFAVILASAYPGSTIHEVINGGHVVVRYKQRLYDIRGDVTDKYPHPGPNLYPEDVEMSFNYNNYSFTLRGPAG